MSKVKPLDRILLEVKKWKLPFFLKTDTEPLIAILTDCVHSLKTTFSVCVSLVVHVYTLYTWVPSPIPGQQEERGVRERAEAHIGFQFVVHIFIYRNEVFIASQVGK